MKRWSPLFRVAAALVGLIVVAAFIVSFRGFRATSEPSRVEVAVARGVRNFAIPRSARAAQSPLVPGNTPLTDARDLFIASCASCHGNDGAGDTPMGRSLYPRVPDLRSARTQALSDGELHYIIEHGVQLTGMPAFGASHRASADDSWKLMLFVRSLRAQPATEVAAQTATLASAHYVGSKSCEKCHAAIYTRWQKTPMANVVRDPREHPDAIIPNLTSNTVAKFTKDQVALVYGSIWKQRYFTKVGEDYFPLAAQWDIGNKKWLPYHVPLTGDWWAKYYPDDNMQRPTGPTCDGCHSVGYNVHTKSVAEWNVGCEQCHGPGSAHVANPVRATIVNPAHMDFVRANDTCIQCHSQGQPRSNPIEGKYYDWPVGYAVGRNLADFWNLEETTPGQQTFLHFADGTAHKNRMQGNDFVQSVMYRRGVTCFSCHDVHGTGNNAQLRKPANKICLDCHAPMGANGPRAATLAAHTHHKDGSTGSDCVSCHMPKIESEGVQGAFVHAHTFRVITPVMTDRYKIPNACTSCHTDKSTSWATDAMRKWSGVSPWSSQ
jgi:predicted CXXCH cytochrome family protein